MPLFGPGPNSPLGPKPLFWTLLFCHVWKPAIPLNNSNKAAKQTPDVVSSGSGPPSAHPGEVAGQHQAGKSIFSGAGDTRGSGRNCGGGGGGVGGEGAVFGVEPVWPVSKRSKGIRIPSEARKPILETHAANPTILSPRRESGDRANFCGDRDLRSCQAIGLWKAAR